MLRQKAGFQLPSAVCPGGSLQGTAPNHYKINDDMTRTRTTFHGRFENGVLLPQLRQPEYCSPQKTIALRLPHNNGTCNGIGQQFSHHGRGETFAIRAAQHQYSPAEFI